MATLLIVFLILALSVGIFIDIPSVFLTVILLFVGVILVQLSNKNEKELIKVFVFSFVCSLFYTLICYIYMKTHNYDKLLINDTEYYIEKARSYLGGNSLRDVIEPIWTDYDAFARSSLGYLSFLTTFGFMAQQTGANLYFTLQLATFAICSFGPVVLYKLLAFYFIEKKYIWSMTVLLTLLPMYFSYSTYILRDGLIALGFYYIIWLLHKSPTPATIMKFALTVAAITTLRTESGYVSILFFPMYLLINNGATKYRHIMVVAIVAVLGIVGSIALSHMNELLVIYNNNYESYFSDTGSGTIAAISKIPVVGGFLAVIYGVVNPMPCCTRMFVYFNQAMPFAHLYNIMAFPSMFYVAFHTYITVYLIRAIFTKSYRNLNIRTLKIVLIPTTIFLLLQSGIVEPRRIMGVFPVFFLMWTVIYKKMSRSYNKTSFSIFLLIFAFFQVVGFIRFL